MTEKNIDSLISCIVGLGVMFIMTSYFLNIMRIAKGNPNKSATQNTTNDKAITIWDKIKILSTIIAAIAGLIYAIVKVIELVRK